MLVSTQDYTGTIRRSREAVSPLLGGEWKNTGRWTSRDWVFFWLAWKFFFEFPPFKTGLWTIPTNVFEHGMLIEFHQYFGRPRLKRWNMTFLWFLLTNQDTLVAIMNLASVLDDMGHSPEAETMYRRCLDSQLSWVLFQFRDGESTRKIEKWGVDW